MPTVGTFTSIINQLLPEPHAGLLSGILFGVKTSLDPALKQALVTTGTLHIIALSGMNVTILTTMIMNSFLWVFPRKIAVVAAIVVVIGFIFFVGPSASVVRAAIMGCMALVGVLFGKEVFALWSWGVAVICMLAFKPLWITDLSFQLSVLASLGMILFGGQPSAVSYQSSDQKIRKDESLNYYRSFLRLMENDLRTTMAAQTLTIPLLLFTFGRLSLISPLTNVLIIWTLPILTVLGLIIVFCGYLFLPLGQFFAWIAWIFLEYSIQVVSWTSKIPGASVGG
jgi:competence protein ComEC